MKTETRQEKIRKYRELKLAYAESVFQGNLKAKSIFNRMTKLRKEIIESPQSNPYRTILYWYWDIVTFVGINEVHRIT